MGRSKLKNKGTNRHHIVPKSDKGRGLDNNVMRLPIDIHNKVHALDRMVDKELVKKDHYYYLIMVGAGYKCK